MSRQLSELARYEHDLPTAFDEYLKEVLGLPIGSERLLWDREALHEKDVALEVINHRFRNQVFDACWSIIDRFHDSPSGRRHGALS